MEKQDVPLNIQKWIRKCLKKQFENTVEKALEDDEEYSDIAERVIRSEEMSALLNSMKAAIAEQQLPKSASIAFSESRPQSAFSFASDLSNDDWNSPKNNDNHYNMIINKISCDKPAHVRLAGYEMLLRSDFSNLNNGSVWDLLQKVLSDGLTDEIKPVFEASLQVHAKLLTCQQYQDVYANLLNAFNAQYHAQKTIEILPTLISGINFKFFLHEKLFRIAHLLIHYQEEMLKSVRSTDKSIEEILEPFIIFLSTHEFGNAMQPKTLNVLNIISVLEPCANWSKRWMLNLATRRTFLAALGKSPSLLHQILRYVKQGLEEIPQSATVSIYEEPIEVLINGNTVETLTYLHCLCFVSQLCAYEAGRKLLTESTSDAPFSVSEFLIASLHALNKLCFRSVNGVYDVSCHALRTILEKPKVMYEPNFYHVALCHLSRLPENDVKIWPHTLDIILHMLDTIDGSLFLISECKEHSRTSENNTTKCPASVVVILASNMLKQPFSIMNTEYILRLFKVMEKLFAMHDAYESVREEVEKEFYPAVSYFFNKLDKCYFENESNAQQINSAVKILLLRMVFVPFGLRALVRESIVFDELIRASITPLRTSWTTFEVVSFISSAAFFRTGYNVLADLAPHVLSTLLTETCKTLEDPEDFFDPWDHPNVDKFLHILAFFSLNIKCFTAFMTSSDDLHSSEEQIYPLNLFEFFIDSINPDSRYHYLGLLSLNTVIWNLNVSVYLMEFLNYEGVLLELQNTDKTEIEDGSDTEQIIDDYCLLRHKILLRTYFIKSPDKEEDTDLEEYDLMALPPQKPNTEYFSDSTYDTELGTMLQESKPGLLDSNWVEQIREAYKASRDPMKNAVMIQLVGQMQKAIPTAEWAENFQWQESVSCSTDFWFSEEMHGVDITLYYAEQNGIMENTIEAKEKLQEFINACYAFIQYERTNKFDGCDWFLSTVFIICEGELERCRTFITQLIQFPSIIFLWPQLGKVIDKTNNEECATQFTFMQLVETIVSNELPDIKYALKSTCGMDWSRICNVMMSQCFWGILPWSEIMHFFAMCILYSPDYMVYYCASLLYHSRNLLLQNVTNNKTWPEHMVLNNYLCHDYINLMDILGKRYGNKILPHMIVKGFDSISET